MSKLSVPRVYVAGPVHGSGTMTQNLHNALRAGDMLRAAGCIPFIPHLYLMWELLRNDPEDQEFWLGMDETWLAQCHALVRLEGKSPGSDHEVAFAKAHNIPVFDSSNLTGAAISDVFVGVRRFLTEYTSGRFKKHLLDSELATYRDPAPPSTITSLDHLQNEVSDWLDRQPFGPGQSPDEPFMGIVEELGELSHARLKARQGIRGSAEELADKERDALGDMIVFMCGYAKARGFRLQECVERAWSEVRERDWDANRMTGAPRSLVDRTPGPYSGT